MIEKLQSNDRKNIPSFYSQKFFSLPFFRMNMLRGSCDRKELRPRGRAERPGHFEQAIAPFIWRSYHLSKVTYYVLTTYNKNGAPTTTFLLLATDAEVFSNKYYNYYYIHTTTVFSLCCIQCSTCANYLKNCTPHLPPSLIDLQPLSSSPIFSS